MDASFNGPSFDLDIGAPQEFFNVPSMTHQIQDVASASKVVPQDDDEVTTKKEETLKENKNVGQLVHQFDLNKHPNDVVCSDVEDVVNSSGVKNLGMKVVPPYERAFFGLNKAVLDLNIFPAEGLDFGLENKEWEKVVHDMVKI